MGKTAFMFPGQGSQYVGMGKGLWDKSEDVRRLYREAGELTGRDIAGLSFEGPEADLSRDLDAQLCVYVCNEAHRLAAADMGLAPDAVTGYSMGFYSALVAAGSLAFADGLKAVEKAGELALGLGGVVRGAMAAVIGLDVLEVEGLCREAAHDGGEGGGVWVSNVNAARQVLVSGSLPDVERAVSLADARGALSAYRLEMGAAYHSPMMAKAVHAFHKALDGFSFTKPAVPLMSYIDARYLDDARDVKETVARQLSSQVLWKDSVLRLIRDGVDNFVEVGPGGALSRMVRWVDRGVAVSQVDPLMKKA